MSPAPPAGATVRSSDAVKDETSFERDETPDVAATAPAPTLRNSRRVVLIPRLQFSSPARPSLSDCEQKISQTVVESRKHLSKSSPAIKPYGQKCQRKYRDCHHPEPDFLLHCLSDPSSRNAEMNF